MDWYQAAAAGVLSGAAAVFAKLVGRRTSGAVGWFVFAFCLLTFQALNSGVLAPWMRLMRAERELLSSPIFQAMKDVDPKTYDQAVALARRGIQNGTDESKFKAEVQNLWVTRISDYLLRASDEAVVAYYGSVVRRLEDLRNEPGICQNLLVGRNTADLAPHLSNDTNTATVSATALLIRTAADRVEPRAIDQEQATSDLTTAAEAVVRSDDDSRALQDPSGPGIDGYRACELYAQLYRAVLRLPDSRAAGVFRTLIAP